MTCKKRQKLNFKELEMDTNIMLSEWKGKLPKGKMRQSSLAELENRLNALDDNQRNNVYFKVQDAKLKSPMLVFLVGGLLLGNLGVGRFMIGDWVLGGIRLALLLFAVVLTSISDDGEMSAIKTICGIVMMVWYFADWFLVDKKLRIQNLRKILQSIDSVKK